MTMIPVLRGSAIAGLFAATLIQAAEPILLKGTADPDPKTKAWYNSSDPDVLSHQIRVLEETVRDQRQTIKNLQDSVQTVRLLNLKLKGEISKRGLNRGATEAVSFSSDEEAADELIRARRQIQNLEKELIALQASKTDPSIALDDKETRDLKALVRTYEKTIASLESELRNFRQTPEPQTAEKNAAGASRSEPPEKQTPSAAPGISAQPTSPPPGQPVASGEQPTPAPEISPAPPADAIPADPSASERAPLSSTTQSGPAPPTISPDKARQGFDLLLAGKVKEAEALFKQIDPTDESFTRAQVGLATIDYSRNKISAANMRINTVLEKFPDNPQALGLSGILAWQDGRAKEAKALLDRAAKLDSHDSQLHNYRAIVLHSEGDYLGAEESLKRAIKLNPNHAEAHFNLAILNTIGPAANRTKAQEYYEKAVLLGSQRDPAFEASLYR